MANIVYTLIARPSENGAIVHLGEYLSNRMTGALSPSDLKSILAKAPVHFTTKVSHPTERYMYHVSSVVGPPCTLVYVCVAEPGLDKAAAYRFLDQIQGAVLNDGQLLARLAHAAEKSLQAELGAKLAALVMEWNGESMTDQGPNSASRVAQLKGQVDEVKQIMTRNVERVLERGERLDQLQDRSEDLNSASQQFRTTAHRVRRRMCCENLKWTIISGIIVSVIVIVLILLILDWAGVFKKN
uniref:Vesicle-associated membrane protein 7 n=1 Tax=Plectus sambesii TaxID=2011161 RepID=A0A914X044_9BILA